MTGPDEREEFRSVFVDAFGTSTDIAAQVTPAFVQGESFTPLIARHDGQTAGCGLLLTQGDVAGVFFIAVRPAFRRQGLGEAITSTVPQVGRDAGCTVGALDSTEMGCPLYSKLGFETVVEYHHFEPIT